MSTAERDALADIICPEKVSYGVVETRFKSAFPASRYATLCTTLREMLPEIFETTDAIALLNLVLVVNTMAQECHEAKILLYDMLVDVDRCIRSDLITYEHIKYSKSSKKSSESVNSDVQRIHSAMKLFAFRLLAKTVDLNTDATALLNSTKEVIDKELVELGNSPTLNAALTALSDLWVAEMSRQCPGDIRECGALLDQYSPDRSAVALTPATAKLPSLPVMAGELQFILLGPSASLMFDSEAPSAEWTESKKLVDEALTSRLSPASIERANSLFTPSIVKRLGVTVKLMNELAQQNAEVCTAILRNMSQQDANAYLQSLLKSSLPPRSLSTIVLTGYKILQQINVRTYISNRMNDLKVDTSNKKDLVKEFATTLHKLVTEHRKENKEIYVNDSVFPDLNTLFTSSDVPEAAAKWEEIKKSSPS